MMNKVPGRTGCTMRKRTPLLQWERLSFLSSRSSPSHKPSQESLAVVFQAATLETSIPSQKDNRGKEWYTANPQRQAYLGRCYIGLNRVEKGNGGK